LEKLGGGVYRPLGRHRSRKEDNIKIANVYSIAKIMALSSGFHFVG
jgi:hypothetical protein